jgi:hypothetical protein
MKTIFCIALFPFLAFGQWSHPAVRCIEDVFRQGLVCPDLSRVVNLYSEMPVELTTEEQRRWQNEWAPDLKFCRAQELLRRENEQPGRYTPVQVQVAWMTMDGGFAVAEKRTALLAAARQYDMPAHVLLGAITQESLLANLGIAPDGGNYSCGMGQLNIGEWCQGIMTLPASERTSMGWPTYQVSCGALPSSLIAPFYEIAETRLGQRPSYRIMAGDFSGITQAQVEHGFPAGSPALQAARYQAATSFLLHCQNAMRSISFKARNLRILYDNYVPAPLKTAEQYPAGQTFPRTCATPYISKAWPLHTGWLMAVAMYNAGPSMRQLVEHYRKGPASTWGTFTPRDLVEALHWGGKFREGTTRIYYTGQDGTTRSQNWYKSCVVQRHVARVVQHVSLGGTPLLTSMEQVPCATGEVPAYRRTSSGVKGP